MVAQRPRREYRDTSMAHVVPFNQPPPRLGSQWTSDRPLQAHMRRLMPKDVYAEVERELASMGELAAELYPVQLADRLHEPRITHYDAWGERIDDIEVSPLWKRAERIAAERGVVATAYEQRHGRYSRIHQFALAYLFGPSTDVYSCPLAMTDGAARTILESGHAEVIERAVPRLTSRDPERFWTSGQWMTESTGGSDVGKSETVAEQDAEGTWRLFGRKWFTSATTSQMALTLARPVGNGPGGRGLALFFLQTRDDAGRLQNIEVHRLKDKLGTRKVPTAELTLRGAAAVPLVGLDSGIRNITPMLNITRTWNAVMSAAGMRRAIALARDYATRREAFGAPLSQKPLHLESLAWMAAETEAALALVFEVVALLGKIEAREADDTDVLMARLLTPLAKLTTGKQAVAVASEALESFGGAGYVEDTGLPTLLRDAQVLPIWEGTTNVLSLDVLRAFSREGALGAALEARLTSWGAEVQDAPLGEIYGEAHDAVRRALRWLGSTFSQSPLEVEAGARRFALTLGRSVSLAALCRHADWAHRIEGDPRSKAAAQRYALEPYDLVRGGASTSLAALAMDA